MTKTGKQIVSGVGLEFQKLTSSLKDLSESAPGFLEAGGFAVFLYLHGRKAQTLEALGWSIVSAFVDYHLLKSRTEIGAALAVAHLGLEALEGQTPGQQPIPGEATRDKVQDLLEQWFPEGLGPGFGGGGGGIR